MRNNKSAVDGEKRAKLAIKMNTLAAKDILVAFSGGVDSAVVLKLAVDAAEARGTNVYAVTFDLPMTTGEDTAFAEASAKAIGGIHQIVQIDMIDAADIRDVHAHAEGRGGREDLYFSAAEALLDGCARLPIQPGVVVAGGIPGPLQAPGQLLAARTVAAEHQRPAWVCRHHALDLSGGVCRGAQRVDQVLTQHRQHHLAMAAHAQAADDLPLHGDVRRCSHRADDGALR